MSPRLIERSQNRLLLIILGQVEPDAGIDEEFEHRKIYSLNHDPLDFIERDFVSGPIVELCRARAFMRRDRLRVFDCAAVQQIRRDPRRAKCMTVPRAPSARRNGCAAESCGKHRHDSCATCLTNALWSSFAIVASLFLLQCRRPSGKRRDILRRCDAPALRAVCRLFPVFYAATFTHTGINVLAPHFHAATGAPSRSLPRHP
jgi:hypothetical protein